MQIEWRKFTNRHLRFARALTLCVGSLLVVNLLNVAAFEGQAGQTKWRTDVELQAKRAVRRPAAREIGYAHVEVNLKRQVLLVVDAQRRALKILPISSGTGKWFTSEGRRRRAVTPTGRFAIYHKIAGWHESPLGMLYYPNYIYRGIAIHGSPSAPSRPASHGCIRIPMFAAKEFSDMTPIGMTVLVYRS